jgi:hypothetical protein
MEQNALENVKNHQNNKIFFILKTSGNQNCNFHLKFVDFFHAYENLTSVATLDSYFPALVS